ncbi:hypothetical protein SDC9_181567 [bioreactor metagenome]|uniref:RNA polymerase sigma factor 70 region 4 type 2 domain-containing protein n=1 Tax=bioreactor metagenome TaxID=1076179 RepID=A0A645H4Z8_9ZZZZ
MIKVKLKNQPEEMQEIFIRHVIDDISIVDLAKLYNMDYAALRKRIYRIKTQLSVSVKVDEVIWTLILISNVPFLLQLTFFSRR